VLYLLCPKARDSCFSVGEKEENAGRSVPTFHRWADTLPLVLVNTMGLGNGDGEDALAPVLT
jgi:hypothetical protein